MKRLRLVGKLLAGVAVFSFVVACGVVDVTSSDSPGVTRTTLTPPANGPRAVVSVTTGFLFPVNWTVSSDLNFAYCGASGLRAYYKDTTHTGSDIPAAVGTTVYAIADGTRAYPPSTAGWGTGNYAVTILHRAWGVDFIAVYGHIRPISLSKTSYKAGEPIGVVGPYPTGSHLHFGVHPGTTLPASGWGRISTPGCPTLAKPNGFVPPISFIKNNSPRVVVAPSVAATDGVWADRIVASWDAVPGATGYKVYRAASRSGSYALIATTATRQYSDFPPLRLTPYFYRVAGYNSGGTGPQSIENTGYRK
jgi:hypothetical protein